MVDTYSLLSLLSDEVADLRAKVDIYETYLHKLALHHDLMQVDGVKDLVLRASNWSYAHRAGNGERSEEEVEEAIHLARINLIEGLE